MIGIGYQQPTYNDLEKSLIIWIKRVQSDMFPIDIKNIFKSKLNNNGRLNKHPLYFDSNGLLRIKKRLLNISIAK